MAIEDLVSKQDLANFIKQQDDAPKAMGAWTGLPALQNGWSGTAYYRVDPRTGLVEFRGQISPGTTTDGTPLFTMPLLPPSECLFLCLHRGAGSTGNATSWLRVGTDGTVSLFFPGATSSGLNLAPVRYPTF